MSGEERLAAILGQVDEETVKELACRVLEKVPDIRVVKTAREGLVMMRARETVENLPFNLGEVLVMECTVAHGSELGWGCCLDGSQDRAYYLAILDLAWNAFPSLRSFLEQALDDAEELLKHEEAILFTNIDRTRVRFEVT